MVSRRFSVLRCIYSSLFRAIFYSSFVGVIILLVSNNPQLGKSRNHNESVFTNDGSNPIVTIPSLGQIMGSFSLSLNGQKYSSFRGIPYAKPPIGELRLMDPKPVEPWKNKIMDATNYGFSCIQPDTKVPMSEDCLTLNIFTPSSGKNRSKPVIVYIHGGGFIGGGSRLYDEPDLFLERDVVLVTINYRLGSLGFMSTGDAEAPGNYGLLDQTLALRWVHDHIDNFGGDPKSVTIMGKSAGGASVEYHILSPRSKGWFNRAISQSGSSLCPWSFSKENGTEENTKKLIKVLNCNRNTSKEILKCLQSRNASEFLNYDLHKKRDLGLFPIGSWFPRVDIERESPFLPAEPEKLIKNQKFNPVPYIMGLALREGALWHQRLIKSGKIGEFEQNPLAYIPSMCGFEYRADRTDLAKLVYHHYLENKESSANSTSLEDMLSDLNFNKCGEDSASLFSQRNPYPTYLYLFAHYQNSTYEADHNAITKFQFNRTPFSWLNDVKISKILVDLWTSFSSNGVPRSDLLPDKWVPLDGSSDVDNYLRIGNLKSKIMVNKFLPFHHRLDSLDNSFNV